MNLRRRTVCVYCGTRIPGALPGSTGRYGRKSGGDGTKEQRFAARFACPEHRSLVALDPEFVEPH